MTKAPYPQSNSLYFKLFTTLLACITLFFSSCAHRQISTKEPSEVGSSLPASVSEIREIKHISMGEEGHESLELSGQLFTKNMVSDSVQLLPCDSCSITMRPSNDSTTIINLKTQRNGQFSFTGKKNTYSFFINNPGLNQIEIHNVDLSKGGHNRIIITIGKGNKLERFYVTSKEGEYAWSTTQQPQ